MSSGRYPAIRPQVLCIAGQPCKIEKPGEMIGNNEGAGCEEGYRGKGNQWPGIGEVLKVNKMTDDGE